MRMMALVGIASAWAGAVAAEDWPVAGRYLLDPAHASLTFEVNHLGFSTYVASFDRWSAELELQPQDLAESQVEGRVDVASLDLPAPPEGFLAQMLGPAWFDAAAFPEIVFRSERVVPTGAETARIEGQLQLLGVRAPVVLEARFRGGWAPQPYDPKGRVGFSARGAFDRSAFGMTEGVPPEGSDLGVGDLVTFRIEAEFFGPDPE